MILKANIKHAYTEQRNNLFLNKSKLIQRDLIEGFTPKSGMIEVISGIRRCGKSTLMMQIMEKFYKHTGYFNFEDSRVYGFEVADFPKLIDVSDKEIDTWFFDEIQNVNGWETFIRQLHDHGIKIYLTGSNASLLSKELGSKLTGRHIRHELFPFSYNEFIRFADTRKRTFHLNEYVHHGGFPVYLESHNNEVLQTLFKDILLRDIAVRYGIRNSNVLMDLALYLVSNIGKEFTYNSLRKKFGIGSANTVSDFLTWMEDSYLFSYLQKFNWSAASRMVTPRKVYIIDTGMANANSLSFSEDRGRLLENMIYSHLRKSGNDIYYFQESKECDFVIFNKRKFVMAIQVCDQITNDNLQRECDGLLEALVKFKSNIGYIITNDQEEVIELEGKTIHLIPADKYLMNGIG